MTRGARLRNRGVKPLLHIGIQCPGACSGDVYCSEKVAVTVVVRVLSNDDVSLLPSQLVAVE